MHTGRSGSPAPLLGFHVNISWTWLANCSQSFMRKCILFCFLMVMNFVLRGHLVLRVVRGKTTVITVCRAAIWALPLLQLSFPEPWGGTKIKLFIPSQQTIDSAGIHLWTASITRKLSCVSTEAGVFIPRESRASGPWHCEGRAANHPLMRLGNRFLFCSAFFCFWTQDLVHTAHWVPLSHTPALSSAFS